jgi:hypothetical protein
VQHEKDFIQAQLAGASGYGSFTIPGLEILWVCPFGGPSLYGRGCDRSRACPQTGRRSNACRDCGKEGRRWRIQLQSPRESLSGRDHNPDSACSNPVGSHTGCKDLHTEGTWLKTRELT